MTAAAAVLQARPPYFRIANAVIDEHAREIGAIGIAIYTVLARHADRTTGESWPWIRTVANKLRLGRSTVKKYLRKLERCGLIEIEDRWNAEGDRSSNLYRLLDPSPAAVAARLAPPAEDDETPADWGGSADDPPPPETGPQATDPRPPGNQKEQDSAEQNSLTCAERIKSTKRQLTCPHPASEVHRLQDGLTICHHCFALLAYETASVDQQHTRAA